MDTRAVPASAEGVDARRRFARTGRPALRRHARLKASTAERTEPLARCPLRLDVPVTSVGDLMAFAAAELASQSPRVAKDFARRLVARHVRRSTGVGNGVALPHADSGYANRLHSLYVRTATAIAFGAPDGEPVTDFLFLVAPRPASTAHTELLARLRRLLSSADVLQRLRCGDVEAALEDLWHRARAG